MKKILIVDDEPLTGRLIKDFLEDQEYEVLVATQALLGLEIVEKEKPDLVLLDMLMPRIGGLECLARIKKFAPETIVIMLSGLQNEEVAKQALELGAYDYLTKPFNLHSIENLLARIFQK